MSSSLTGEFKKIIPLKISVDNPVILFMLFVLAYIALDFMSMAGQAYILEHWTKHKHISWVSYLWLAAGALLILYILTKFLHISLLSIETKDI